MGVATLPPRRAAASAGSDAGEADKRAREEGAREERQKRLLLPLFCFDDGDVGFGVWGLGCLDF